MPEAPLSDYAVYQARPTLRFDGQEREAPSSLLESLRMSESEGGLSSLEARFSNIAPDASGPASLAFDDDQVLGLGKGIEVYCGDENGPTEVFRGKITGVEAVFTETGAEFVVLAEDAFQKARMQRRSKVHDNLTLSGLLGRIASQLNLTPVIDGLTDDLGTQVQLNESDLAFARRLLMRADADLRVVGSELHAGPRGNTHRGDVTLELHNQLRGVRILADLARQVSSVTVTGWDPAQGQRVSATSRDSGLQPGAGDTGASLLERRFQRRPHHFHELAVAAAGEAQAVADAVYSRLARGFVTPEGTAEGNPRLRVGTHLTIAGAGRFDNTYYVTETVHRFDMTHGYQTDFRAECACLGAA